ncbi:hypothetical protein PRIPAC_93412 [Pristionchus pacificus]|uniref:Uncharacterized protein n=1 Tax=Pristionchus pacificus TaxID=54126 RepID=A0A454XMC2_PRIPA|nr:hypothetical protein PRIPAC_93412 [Pristionchus pacificus]|eukprot:PDM77575.1 hypothetical protein PRIPAC_34442 [Pristionchus pacificus]
MPTTVTLLFTIFSCALLVANVDSASLPVACFDPISASSAEGCLEMLRMAKRSPHSIAAAPEKKGYDYIRFGKRSGAVVDDSHSAEEFQPYQFVERPRMATRNFVFKPFLV